MKMEWKKLDIVYGVIQRWPKGVNERQLFLQPGSSHQWQTCKAMVYTFVLWKCPDYVLSYFVLHSLAHLHNWAAREIAIDIAREIASFAIASMHLLSHCKRYLITRFPLILVGFSCSVAPNSCFQSLPGFRNNGFFPPCCQYWCYYCQEKKIEQKHPRCKESEQYPRDRARQAWVSRGAWQELCWLCSWKWCARKNQPLVSVWIPSIWGAGFSHNLIGKGEEMIIQTLE